MNSTDSPAAECRIDGGVRPLPPFPPNYPLVSMMRSKSKWLFSCGYIDSAQHMEEAANELERLRRVEQTARVYFDHYLHNEADDLDCCRFGYEQHNRAKLLRGALNLAAA